MANDNSVYSNCGKEFRFNDFVELRSINLPVERRCGRLVQVRKNCGAYGSDFFFVRLINGDLAPFENVAITTYQGDLLRVFPDSVDSVQEQYTYKGGLFPETGFLIDQPKEPMSKTLIFQMLIESVS